MNDLISGWPMSDALRQFREILRNNSQDEKSSLPLPGLSIYHCHQLQRLRAGSEGLGHDTTMAKESTRYPHLCFAAVVLLFYCASDRDTPHPSSSGGNLAALGPSGLGGQPTVPRSPQLAAKGMPAHHHAPGASLAGKVCRQLGVSESSLRRRLQEEGCVGGIYWKKSGSRSGSTCCSKVFTRLSRSQTP